MRRSQMDGFQDHVTSMLSSNIETGGIGKCLTYIFGYILSTTFTKDYDFGSNCQKPLPKLVSTDPLGSERAKRGCSELERGLLDFF